MTLVRESKQSTPKIAPNDQVCNTPAITSREFAESESAENATVQFTLEMNTFDPLYALVLEALVLPILTPHLAYEKNQAIKETDFWLTSSMEEDVQY